MEGEIITKGTGLIVFGALFLWLGVDGWKNRRTSRINAIEALILKAGNTDPLPRDRWDRAMAFVQPVLMLVFGPVMVSLGLVILFN